MRLGRPARAGARATRRVELRLTDEEHAALSRLAATYDCKVADALRLGALFLAAIIDEGDAPPILLGGRMSFAVVPAAAALELLPVKTKPGCASSSQEGTPS